MVGELVNQKQAKHRHKGKKATVSLKVVYMDIGYGYGLFVGRYKYMMVLVHQYTTQYFFYGIHGCSGADICEALRKYFINAGVFSPTIQCNFVPRLIVGKAAASLHLHNTNLCMEMYATA